jgi:hypothetical protein
VRPRTAAAALLTALALGGFGPPGVAAAQPGTDVAACLDGSCTLRITGPVEIPLDGRVGATGLTVSSIGPYAVRFQVHRSTGGDGLGVVGRSGTVRFTTTQGTLAVRVLELGPDAAVVELSSEPG